MQIISNLPIAIVSIIFTSSLFAYTAPSPKSSRVTGALILLEDNFEHNGDTITTHGDLLFGGYRTPMTPRLSLGGGIGVLVNGTIDHFDNVKNGSGFRLQGDGDFTITQFGKNKLLTTFGLGIDRFTYHGNGTTININTMELVLGGLYVHHVQKISLYGGLELFLLASDKIDVSVAGYSASNNMDRDGKLNLRLGMAIAASPTIDFKVDLYLMSQQTILLGCDVAI